MVILLLAAVVGMASSILGSHFVYGQYVDGRWEW